jgi:D-alanyl-D-alanine carboxypeptidase
MLRPAALCLASLILLHATDGRAQGAQAPAPAPVRAPAATAPASPPGAGEQDIAARIDSLAAPLFKPNEPGATIIVTRAGQTVYRKAFGMADQAAGRAMTPDTVLRLGSITKQFTATAILMLAEEGKLSVSDDITKFLPDYPTRGKHITVEHLLTHTSGIVSYTSKPTFGAVMNQDMTVAQMIATFSNDPLDFEPGTRHLYNNSGYFLLGAIIEKVSGMPYAKFVEQRIFVPLGMNQSAYEGHERSKGPRAAGHTRNKTGFEPSAPLSMALPYAAGALVSSVDDLARWDAAITSGKLLKAASYQKAFTAYTLADGKRTGYGYGWGIGKLRGMPMIAHGGGINGFSTFALRLPEQQLYVAVLTNADSGLPSAEQLALKAAAIAAGDPFPVRKEIKLDAKLLGAYQGTYKIDDKSVRTFRSENGQLVMERNGRGKTVIPAFSENGFFVENSTNYLEFQRDAKGEVNQVTLYGADAPTVLVRVGPL